MTKVGIVAHASRFDRQLKLADTVHADYVSIDDGALGCDGNHRAVWEHLMMITGPNEWALVLEDDALPVIGFRRQLELALTYAPTEVCSFYLGQERPPQWMGRVGSAVSVAARQDRAWILIDAVIHGVAVAMPGRLIPSMLEAVRASNRPIDEAMTQWCRCCWPVRQVAYSQPSLVQHADLPTIVDHVDGAPRPHGRVAWRLGTRNHWNRRTVRL